MQRGKLLKIKCHERPITTLKFNTDGDLLFTASKDSRATVIRPDGTPLGSYAGHEGSIFTLSVSPDSQHLYTGSADQTIIDWDLETGIALTHIDTGSVVKACDSYSEHLLVAVSDDSMGMKREIFLYDNRTKEVQRIFSPSFNATGIFADYSSSTFMLSDVEGSVHKFDSRSSTLVASSKLHTDKISEIQPSACRTFFLTSSIDAQAKIVDCEDLTPKRIFVCEEPVNSSAIFPTNDKVVCVGGVDARDVTTTKGKSTVDTSFFDIVTSERVGYFSTHYGTINTVDIHPLCTMYCSAGEEGIVNIVTFGEDFYASKFTKIN
ncbi:Eukaryotic translation initiation factor 3 subunit I [Nosema granulosis]|uniref:Serine-threonine kinase receptor-associated protein n=1 Tax=Nosema granulosis TaxID=83296 RepID=A0A9P6H191_9MICR|nr:Eukaryotic translation initiation factor 3 subunit I [Nosema granulosis]